MSTTDKVSQICNLVACSKHDYKPVILQKIIHQYFTFLERVIFDDFMDCLYSTIKKDEEMDFRSVDEFFRYFGGCLRNKEISYKSKI